MSGSRKLKLSARRRGRRLQVSVIVPASEHGAVTVRLKRRRGKHLRLLAKHRARPHHHRARTVFRLSKRLRHAHTVVLVASARGARTARLRVPLRKRR